MCKCSTHATWVSFTILSTISYLYAANNPQSIITMLSISFRVWIQQLPSETDTVIAIKRQQIMTGFNILRLRKISCHFASNIFKYFFLYGNCYILITISLKSVLKSIIDIYLIQWWSTLLTHICINLSPPGQDGCHFADDIFRCIFMNETFCILIKISLEFVPKGPINNNPSQVEIKGI